MSKANKQKYQTLDCLRNSVKVKYAIWLLGLVQRTNQGQGGSVSW